LFLFKSHPKPFFSLASAEDFSSAFATFDSFGDSAGGFSGLVSLESADGVGAGGGVLASGVVVDFVAGGADFSDFSAFGAFAAGGADFSTFGAFAAGGGVVAAGGGVVGAGGGVVGAGGGVVGAGGGMVAAAGGVAVGGELGAGAAAGFGGVFSSFLVSAAGAAVLVGAGGGIATGLGGVAVGKGLLGGAGSVDGADVVSGDEVTVPAKALFSRRKYISAIDILGAVSFLDLLYRYRTPSAMPTASATTAQVCGCCQKGGGGGALRKREARATLGDL